MPGASPSWPGSAPVSPASGAAADPDDGGPGAPRAVVEIGTGTGVSGICLLRGMRADGVLTTVDVQPGLQRQAREVFAGAGFATGRARCIPGAALEVLPRLADGQYDLVFCDGDPAEDAGVRLLNRCACSDLGEWSASRARSARWTRRRSRPRAMPRGSWSGRCGSTRGCSAPCCRSATGCSARVRR